MFALRGARLTERSAYETVDSVKLADVRPDHQSFRCTLGFYNRANRKLSAFRGSTVPNVEWMTNYYKKIHDIHPYRSTSANMLPTGCYVYRVEHHRTIYPALRLTNPERLSLDGKVTVLRTSNDLTFAMDDDWDPCEPFDNLHCAYSDDVFSSAGCLTIMGRDGQGPWGRFQDVLKTMPRGARLDVVLLTGREAAIAAYLVKERLTGDGALVKSLLMRLRPGSRGEAVNRLQARLGTAPSGYFGWNTKKLLVESQLAANVTPDGILSPRLDRNLGWGVFGPPDPVAPLPRAADTDGWVAATGTVAAHRAPPSSSETVRPTLDQLKAFAHRNAKPEYLAVIAEEADRLLLEKGITANPMRFCHFIGQVGSECGGFRITHESLYYTTAAQLCKVWPSRFPTLKSARPYLRNEQKLAEKVYFGRLGNDQPGDGFRYRGRGFIQITGRENYRSMGLKIGEELEANPDLAIEPRITIKIAAQTWLEKALPGERDMNRLSELNKLDALTYRVNGGYTNIDDRKACFESAWRLWGQGAPPQGSGEPDTVERGDRGELVGKLKSNLAELGYRTGDGGHVFGSKTYHALYQFQKEHALPPTGVAGPETWAALERASRARPGTRSLPTHEWHPARPRSSPPALGPLVRALRTIRNAAALLSIAAAIFAMLYLAGLTQPDQLGHFSSWAPLLFAGMTFIAAFVIWHWSTGVWVPAEPDPSASYPASRDWQSRDFPEPVGPEDPEPVRSAVPHAGNDP